MIHFVCTYMHMNICMRRYRYRKEYDGEEMREKTYWNKYTGIYPPGYYTTILLYYRTIQLYIHRIATVIRSHSVDHIKSNIGAPHLASSASSSDSEISYRLSIFVVALSAVAVGPVLVSINMLGGLRLTCALNYGVK